MGTSWQLWTSVVWYKKAVQGPRIQVPAFAGAGTVNRTPPYRALIRTISINGTRNERLERAMPN